jgi:thiol-disulfide isomerase/thioredoxin
VVVLFLFSLVRPEGSVVVCSQLPARLVFVCLSALSLLALAGCDKEDEKKAPDTESLPEIGKVQLKVARAATLLKEIQSHKGKVVVVDFWETRCPPCLIEFPNLVKLHQRHARDGVVCISVSLDDPGSKKKALEFLKNQRAEFPNFFMDFPDDEFALNWNLEGMIPAIFVYDRKGRQALFAREYREGKVFETVESLLTTLEEADPPALLKAIEQNKGKVVVVDFWTTSCPPCRKEFPNLVELHNKYGADRVACISVSLDDREEYDEALKFLRGQKAWFANFLLDNNHADIAKHWELNAFPTIVVYDQQGKQVLAANEYQEVLPRVEELVKSD